MNDLAVTGYPYLAKTASVNGGACHNPSLACYNLHTAHRYQSPSWLRAAMHPRAGQWNLLQIYRLVNGKRLVGKTRWDCTPANWQDRWAGSDPGTGDPMSGDPTEVYCWRDYMAALDSIAPGTVTVSPAQVPRP